MRDGKTMTRMSIPRQVLEGKTMSRMPVLHQRVMELDCLMKEVPTFLQLERCQKFQYVETLD